MKIAFVLSYPTFSPSNGIVSQALTWKKGLEDAQHEVYLINMWDKNDWKIFDVIHFFGFSQYMNDLIIHLSKSDYKNIVVSPILDPNYSLTTLKVRARWGSNKLRLTNQYHSLYTIRKQVNAYFVRSEYEKEYLSKGFDIERSKCIIIPLAYGIDHARDVYPDREPFCLHISLLADKRKNVKSLIAAAQKYNFRLLLGGKLRNNKEYNLIKSWIKDSDNIEYLGFLSDEEIKNLYQRAKVFALPSLYEGVGIVALDAAVMGCNIVITKQGGPKEYYANMAKIVDPNNVDDIGNAIVDFLGKTTFQPELTNYIQSNYSLPLVTKKLEEAYNKLTK